MEGRDGGRQGGPDDILGSSERHYLPQNVESGVSSLSGMPFAKIKDDFPVAQSQKERHTVSEA